MFIKRWLEVRANNRFLKELLEDCREINEYLEEHPELIDDGRDLD